MPNIHSLNRSGVVNTLVSLAIVLAVVSLASAGSLFLIFVLAAAGGGLIGLAVARSRTGGLGSAEVGERAPDFAGKVGHINMAHIPVMGIGGLGIVAMALFVGVMLPAGRTQLAWGLGGAIIGAGTLIAWRHQHGTSPFAEHPEETLHLR